MRLCEMDPFVRFAAGVRGDVLNRQVRVRDCRIFYVEEGQARIFIDNGCCQLTKNSLFYCPGGSTYRLETQGNLQLVCINFDLDRTHDGETVPFAVCAGQEQWADLKVYFQTVEDSGVLNSHLLVEDAAQFRESVWELVREHGENSEFSSLLCGSLLKALLLRLHRVKKQQLPPKLAQVQEFIRVNYMQELTNARIAQQVGYHEYYLNRMFHTYTGMNLHEYLVMVRLEQAVYLMLNTQLPLSSIAEQVGIRSYPHFSACFKNRYGCSPLQYRSRF